MFLIGWLEILCVNKIPNDMLNYLTITVSQVKKSTRLRIFCLLLLVSIQALLCLILKILHNPKPNKSQKGGRMNIKLSKLWFGFEASAALLAGSRGSGQTFYLITNIELRAVQGIE